MNRVIIDMSNPNALVSLAYIKTNDNPLQVFCNYVLYLILISPSTSLRLDDLKSQLRERFGLEMPWQMLNMCLRILKKNKEVDLLPHGAGYSAGETDFSITFFENEMKRLQEQEVKVLSSLACFVKNKYKQVWTEENAKKYLSQFLEMEGNAVRLFLHQDIPANANKVPPSWYVGRYITSIQGKTDSLEKAYMEDIVKGMMIYIGITQTNDYQQDKGQKFRGTTFFFDTKLILRLLGYSWNAQVESTRELYELITKEYGGKVCIFPQTLTEIKNAMDTAGKCVENARPIVDEEIRFYAQLNPEGASLLSDYATVVEQLLKEKFSIELSPQVNWNKDGHLTIGIDEIVDYISSKHPAWKKGAVQYDVEIINQINILRRADYSVKYGTIKKLPVFITSNVDLVYSFRSYVEEKTNNDPATHWNIHALPVISDTMILFRLWLPYAKQYNDLPSVTLSRYAYAAQNSDTRYFEKLRETALSYESQEGINLLDLNDARRRKLEDILVAHSEGNAEALTTEVMATSIEELVALENLDLHTKVSEYENRFKEQDSLLSEKTDQIVALLAKPFINKVGCSQVLVFLAKGWWVFATVLIFIVKYIINKSIGILIIGGTFSWLITGLPVLIELFFILLDKKVDSLHLQDFLIG